MSIEHSNAGYQRAVGVAIPLLICTVLSVGISKPSCAAISGDTSQSATDTTVKAKADKDSKTTLQAYTGPKKRVAVMDLDVKVAVNSSVQPTVTGGLSSSTSISIPPPSDFGTGLTEMLTTSLIESGRFIVLERKSLSDLQNEVSLGSSSAVDQLSAAGTGRLLGAQAIIRGAVTEYSFNRSSSGGNASFLNGVGVSSEKTAASVVIDIRLCDVATGQVLDSVKAEGRAKSFGSAIDVDKADWKMSAASFKQTPLGNATRQAIDKAIKFICNRMQKMPWEGKIADVEDDGQGQITNIYINAGSVVGLQEGNILEVLHPGRAITDPETRLIIGRTKDTKLGRCKIESVTKDLSIAKVVEGSGFKPGDVVHIIESSIKPSTPEPVPPTNTETKHTDNT